jgi:hypothetical protein
LDPAHQEWEAEQAGGWFKGWWEGGLLLTPSAAVVKLGMEKLLAFEEAAKEEASRSKGPEESEDTLQAVHVARAIADDEELRELAIATENAALDRAHHPVEKRREDVAKEKAEIRGKITKLVEMESENGEDESEKVFKLRFPPAQLAKLEAQIEQTKKMMAEVDSGVEAVDWLSIPQSE